MPRHAAVAGLLLATLLLVSPDVAKTSPAGDHGLYSKDELAAILAHSPPGPLPADPTDRVADNAEAARLGQALFFDAGFAANGKINCASCHQPARAFTDGRAIARGLALGNRNAPTLLNAAYNHWFFWDGRADSLWSQVLQVEENPREVGSDRLQVAHVIYRDAPLRRDYEGVFGPMPALADARRFPAHGRPDTDATSTPAVAWAGMAADDRTAVDRVFANVGKAIEAYERKLAGRRSRFDDYVDGLRSGDAKKLALLSASAKRGLKLFVGAGHCDLCHAGPAFSDGEFHNIGLPALGDAAPDPGRSAAIPQLRANPFNGSGRFSDAPGGEAHDKIAYLPPPASQAGAFKTPSLRNVALTAPYMHDGRFATLAQVVAFYAEGKAASRGRREATLDLVPHFGEAQSADLVAFLETLNGAPPDPALTRPPPR